MYMPIPLTMYKLAAHSYVFQCVFPTKRSMETSFTGLGIILVVFGMLASGTRICGLHPYHGIILKNIDYKKLK